MFKRIKPLFCGIMAIIFSFSSLVGCTFIKIDKNDESDSTSVSRPVGTEEFSSIYIGDDETEKDADDTFDGDLEKNSEEHSSVETEEETSEHIHSFGEFNIDVPATCTDEGHMSRACSICGEEESEVIAPLGHNEVTVGGVQVGCLTDGVSDGVICGRCGEIIVAQVVIPSSGHKKITVSGYAADCTTDGLSDGIVCADCGVVIMAQEVIPSLGHTKQTVEGYPADCTSDGLSDGAICITCGVVVAEQVVIPALGHKEVTVSGYPASCTTDGLSDGVACSACNAVIVPQEAIVALGHKEVTVSGYPAGCTTDGLSDGVACSACNAVIVPQEAIVALGHKEVTVSGYPASCTTDGLSDGVACAGCQMILVAQTVIPMLSHSYEGRVCTLCGDERVTTLDISRFESDYFYEYVSGLPNGEDYAELYDVIGGYAEEFHGNGIDASEMSVGGGSYYYYFATVDYVSLGLTLDEAASVLRLYMLDHPLYYWLNGSFIYNSRSIYLCVHEEYYRGYDREEYNLMVYDGIEDIILGIDGNATAYTLALAYHDAIISAVDYAYEADGVTPSSENRAHNIVGLFDGGNGVVCEGYADAFNLLLNYSGIENIQVPGMAYGGGHIWNLVRLDDGEWYWYDVTWDDDPASEWGIEYQFFCVNDRDDVYKYYCDGGYTVNESSTFLQLHSINWELLSNLDMSDAVPARATGRYDGDELVLRESFSSDGMTYALAGYNDLQLVSVSLSGDVIIPETVTYGGIEYEVIAIGGMGGDGVYSGESVIWGSVTSIYISASVKYIWRNALSSSGLKSVTFAENNRGVVIGESAFYGCSRLSSVTLCRAVTSIGENAFYRCTFLWTITYVGTKAEWNSVEKQSGWSSGIMMLGIQCTDGTVSAR